MVSILLPLQMGHGKMSRDFDNRSLNIDAHQKHVVHIMKQNLLSSFLVAARIVCFVSSMALPLRGAN
jgi:hypothetical protein